MGKLTRDS